MGVVIVDEIAPINRQMILIAVGRDDCRNRSVAVVNVSVKGTADEADVESCCWRRRVVVVEEYGRIGFRDVLTK